MAFLAALWLPILASAAAVWFTSALFWMAVGHHNKDYGHLADEAGFIAEMKKRNIAPGNYAFPNCADHSRMKDPAIQELMKSGPMGFITFLRTPMSMGRNMISSFLVYLAISIAIAYLGWSTLPHTGLDMRHGFKVLITAGILGYSFAHVPNGIWFGQSTRAMVLCVLDGIVYGLVTGVIFCFLWPK